MEFKFNFEGKNQANVFGLTNDEGEAFSRKLADVTGEIAENLSQYQFSVSKEESEVHEGEKAWHMGKILEKPLTCATSDIEKITVVSSLDKAVHFLTMTYEKREFLNSLKSATRL